MLLRRFINKENLPRIKVLCSIINAYKTIPSGIYIWGDKYDELIPYGEKLNIISTEIGSKDFELKVYNENNIFYNRFYDKDGILTPNTSFEKLTIGEGFECVVIQINNDLRELNIPDSVKILRLDGSNSSNYRINELKIGKNIEFFKAESTIYIDNFYYDNNNITSLEKIKTNTVILSNDVYILPSGFPAIDYIPNHIKIYLSGSLYNFTGKSLELELDNVILSHSTMSGTKNIKSVIVNNVNILPTLCFSFQSLQYIDITLHNVKYVLNMAFPTSLISSLKFDNSLLFLGNISNVDFYSNHDPLILPKNLKYYYCSKDINNDTGSVDVYKLTFNCKNLITLNDINYEYDKIPTFFVKGELIIGEEVEYINTTFGVSTNITTINIPNSVKEIGEYAFRDCLFSSVTLPESVKKVGKYAFNDETEITILGELEDYSNIKKIKDMEYIDGCYYYNNELFRVDNIETINVKDGCVRITADLTKHNNIKTINIPASVEYIKKQLFYLSDVNINIDENNKHYSTYGTKNTIININDKEIIAIDEYNPVIPEIAEKFIDKLFNREYNTVGIYCINFDFVIPDTIKYIGDQIFRYTKITINSVADLKNVSLECNNLHINQYNTSSYINKLLVRDNFKYSGSNKIIGINSVNYYAKNIVSTLIGGVVIALNGVDNVSNVTQIYTSPNIDKTGSNKLIIYVGDSLTKMELPDYIDTIDYRINNANYADILSQFAKIEFLNSYMKNYNIMFNGKIVEKISINADTTFGHINNFISTYNPIVDKNIIIPNNVTKCSLYFVGDITVDLRNINENIDMSEAVIRAHIDYTHPSQPTILVSDTFLKLKKLPKFSAYLTPIKMIYDKTVEEFIDCISENEEFIKNIGKQNYENYSYIEIHCTNGTIKL